MHLRNDRRKVVAAGFVLTLAAAMVPGVAGALTGSVFEIDTDANLIVDTPGNTDWASLAHANIETDPEKRAVDLDTGQDDNSY